MGHPPRRISNVSSYVVDSIKYQSSEIKQNERFPLAPPLPRYSQEELEARSKKITELGVRPCRGIFSESSVR